MAAIGISEQSKGINRHVLQGINHAVDILGLADGDILSLTTTAGLQAAIVTLAGSAENKLNFARQINKNIDAAVAIGTFTDALVAAANTVAGLRTLCTQEDALLDSTNRAAFAF